MASNVYIIITSKSLVGECLVSELRRRSPDETFESFRTTDDAIGREGSSPSLVLLHVPHSGRDFKLDLDDAVSTFSSIFDGVPFGILSDVEDVGCIRHAIGRGAKCYIPTTVTVIVVSQVLRLVAAGGFFIPWTAMMQPSSSLTADDEFDDVTGLLSSKEAQVVRALRRGTQNKLIAYQLNMCESTVKVHIRNIMRKLNAKSRSQIVFLTERVKRRESARHEELAIESVVSMPDLSAAEARP